MKTKKTKIGDFQYKKISWIRRIINFFNIFKDKDIYIGGKK